MPRLMGKTSMWFDYPDDPDGGKVEVCNLTDQDIAEIGGLANKERTLYDPVSGKGKIETSYSSMVDAQETVVRAVAAWKNFFNADGSEMECSAANKRRWACDTKFARFVNDKRKIVALEAAKRLEDARKNSSAMPPGSPV